MARQITKTTKLLLTVLVIIIIIGVIVIIIIPRIGKSNSLSQTTLADNATTTVVAKENTAGKSSTTIKLTQEEEYRQLVEDKNFVSIFNDFEYPGSTIKDAKLVEQDGSMFYIVLETKDSFDKVDNFYKSKNIQSIWSRSEIFEVTNHELEESFLNPDNEASQNTQETTKYFKYSFTSEKKDQLLNILARSYSQDLTQVMIIYWKLSN
jgi:competence protein ComGC